MATHLYPSSYRCDCGHELNFFENTIREMSEISRKRSKPQTIGEGDDRHCVEFKRGNAVAVICPKLGRCAIKDQE
jgi:hypothetical protein